MQAIIGATGVAILVLDNDLKLKSCNSVAVKQFRISVDSCCGLALDEAVPNGAKLLSDAFIKQLRSFPQQSISSEISFNNCFYNVVAVPVVATDSYDSCLVLSFSDVSEWKDAESAFIETDERLTCILNTMLAGIVIIDPETHRIIEVNRTAARLIGDNRSNIIGSVCHEYISPAVCGQCPLTDLHQVIDNAESILLTANKTQIAILKTAIIIKLSGKNYILESFIDIQARKEAENQLQQNKKWYQLLYSTMKEGMAFGEVIYDESGNAIDCILFDVNQACANLLGMDIDILIGARLSQLSPINLAGQLRMIDSVVKSGKPQEYELKLRSVGKVISLSISSPEPDRFAAIINDITASKKAQKEIERLAYFDTLTGLPNRALIKDRLQQVVVQAERAHGLVGVLAVDLDHFKKINDSLGVGFGDQMLKTIAERLDNNLRQGDSVARMGGDEFVIVLSGNKSKSDIVTAANKVLDILRAAVIIDGHELVCTASVGIAIYPTDADNAELLLKNADTAMYNAKETGRNTYQFYTPAMNTMAFERLFLDADLHRALQRNELELYYQPQIGLTDSSIVGVEALLRWNHAQKGQISPAVFIPIAEESDVILEIGQWVMQQACRQMRLWYDQGYQNMRVAVNLSARQFRDDLPDIVAHVLRETGLPPQLLELELTESLLMDKPEMARIILEQLQYLGVQLSIDDFGTGYSSLSYLKHFPLNSLKIDRSFVKDLGSAADDAVIIEAIIALAHGLRLQVVAEGVETAEQLEFMRSKKCDHVQGFFFAKPMPVLECSHFLRDFKPTE